MGPGIRICLFISSNQPSYVSRFVAFVTHDAPDVLLSSKETKFCTMSFRVLFNLVFVSIALLILQVGLAFHQLRMNDTGTALLSVVFSISILKLFMCNLVRFVLSISTDIPVLGQTTGCHEHWGKTDIAEQIKVGVEKRH